VVRGSWIGIAVAVAALAAAPARAATTSFDASGTILVDGTPTFPIVLAQGPPADGTTPWGTGALGETVDAGVNFFKIGPATTPWTSADVADAIAWDRAAKAAHVYTWVNLSTVAAATPASPADTLLAQVVEALTHGAGSSAIGMWKGVDEPWWSGLPPPALQFPYCRVTSRGDPSWCAGEPALDSRHLWVTIEAPRGGGSDLAPYDAVTDVHGVDVYPVTLGDASPDLHQVGVWTSTIAAVSPGLPVWTTLEVCASGSSDGAGSFVLPTLQQERYMVYDAIVNGASALAFYGGNNRGCWNASDAGYGWNWTFWSDVLKPLLAEIGARSELAPALVRPGTTTAVTTDDPTTEAIARQGATVDDLWVIAARSGPGTQTVTLGGLPSWAAGGTVYTENRSVTAAGGSFADTFDQWDVHVYHFVEAPSLSAATPSRGRAGRPVTLTGAGLAATQAVSFGTAPARFRVLSDTELSAVVPRRARTAPIVVVSPGGTAATATPFGVAPSSHIAPVVRGVARLGRVLTAGRGSWYGAPTTYTFRWQRCDRRGLGCATIAHATGRRYGPGRGDLGARLRVVVVARNGAGSARGRSAPTSVVE
jgi:hypothetical protein